MIARLRSAWSMLMSFCVSLAPSAALACPACTAREGTASIKTLGILAAMVFLPFVVAGVVIHVIRRLESDSPYRP